MLYAIVQGLDFQTNPRGIIKVNCDHIIFSLYNLRLEREFLNFSIPRRVRDFTVPKEISNNSAILCWFIPLK